MELAEQLDPEEWHAILDKFFAILTDGVHRFEGTVNQYTGDGIMALFGAPIRAAVEVAQTKHCRPDEVRAHLAGAHTQLRRADGAALARAEQALVRAQKLIEEIGARAFQPELHECRARLARVRGDARAADSDIKQARRLYAAMGATAQVDRLSEEIR